MRAQLLIRLDRSLGFGLLLLYGIGTTVGAGIYALVGEIVGIAGWLAPWSFLVASLMAGLTAMSFAELSGRFPRAAGTALYVQEGLGAPGLARLVGVLVILSGMVSSAALVNGMTGYVQAMVEVPEAVLIPAVVTGLALIAVWGIEQSAWVAGVISLVEVGGLVWIILLSMSSVDLAAVDWTVFRPHSGAVLPVLAGAVLSFYAYIGFEDMVEVAEEVRDVRRTLPRTILVTLLLTSLIYVLLLVAVLVAVGPDFLAGATAPLAAVHGALTGGEGRILGVIALFAIINGALIQIIMASRVVYGLAARGQLPAAFAYVQPRFRTPVVATLTVASGILLLALIGHLSGLAETTSVLMLSVFALANLALWRLKGRGAAPEGVWQVPRLLPLLGFVVCSYFVAHAISGWLA